MLDKHLGHLKKQPQGMEHMVPPPPSQVGSAKRSFKSEDSPATSPATASNWNSPSNLTGVSPVGSTPADDPYMHAVHNNAAPGSYSVQPAPLYNTSPGGPMSAPPRAPPPPQQQRRGISEITGGAGDIGGDAKRQQMYAPGPQTPLQQRPPQMTVGPSPSMPQSMQRPPR